MTTTLEDGDTRPTTVLRRKAGPINSHNRRATGPLSTPARVDLTYGAGGSLESQWLAAIVEGSDDAIISKTMEGSSTIGIAAATRIFGYTAEEMIGSPITRIIPVRASRLKRRRYSPNWGEASASTISTRSAWIKMGVG